MTLHRLTTAPIGNFGFFIPHDWFVFPEPRCPECEWLRKERVFPLELEYVPGPPGDFYSAIRIALARREVAEDLAAKFAGLEPKPVKHQELRRRPSYKGPELAELWFPLEIPPNPGLSDLKLVGDCSIPEHRGYTILGTEMSRGDIEVRGDGRQVVGPAPREPGHGVILHEADLRGLSFFRFVDCQLCTGEVADYIRGKEWTNVDLPEFGETI